MRRLLVSFLALTPLSAAASWEVKSDFQLHLSEGLFDKVIEDFQQSLSGQQTINVGNITITPEGIPVQINGIRVELNYAFALPQRVDSTHREWSLSSTSVSAKLYVDSINAHHTVQKVINGIIVDIDVSAECHNVLLELPSGLTSVHALVDASLAQNQIHLTMPAFSADWKQGAWQVTSMSCSGDTAGFGAIVREQALAYFSTFQNLDAAVRGQLESKFALWSQQASVLLLSQQELPSGVDYLKIHYSPKSASENEKGILLEGQLDFEYPYVAQGQTISQSYQLASGSAITPTDSPQLLVPFATLRALMMGEYFAGKLEYGIRSTEIPAFQNLMSSYFQRLFGFPDLLNYDTSSVFLFQVIPVGPPSFRNARNAGAGAIAGDMVMPLAVRMYAPVRGIYWPYVEFQTTLLGPSLLNLGQNGQVDFKIAATEQPTTYAWSKKYVDAFRPNTSVAVDTIGKSVRDSLNSQGLKLRFPSLNVGQSLELLPAQWQLNEGNLLVDFSAKLKPAAKK